MGTAAAAAARSGGGSAQRRRQQQHTQEVKVVARRAMMLNTRKFRKLGRTLIIIATPPNTSAHSLQKVWIDALGGVSRQVGVAMMMSILPSFRQAGRQAGRQGQCRAA
jgi:hypothetical protein